jgi:hypothetical protein
MGERRRFWWENLRKRDHLENTGVDGKIILKWTFKKCDGKVRTGLIWNRIAILKLRVP